MSPLSGSLTLRSPRRSGVRAFARGSGAVSADHVDPSLGEVMVPVARFYEKCEPLIMQTIDATEAAMRVALGPVDDESSGLGVVYLVGGSCELPVLARALRERFGKRVRRSPYPSGATAIGLAIAADQEAGYVLSDRFNRHFGVWRESEGGQRIVFDPIFTKETRLPRPGEPALVVGRRYHPVHNIGRFRYLECSTLRHQSEPAGDILAWQEILFPYTPDLVSHRNLKSVPFKVRSILEVLDEYVREGRIKLDPSKNSHPVTYHDSCNLGRKGGLFEEPRRVLQAVAGDFREMTPNRAQSVCCGGGSGLVAVSEWSESRLKAGEPKSKQIRESGAKVVVTSCDNCRHQINELNETNGLGITVTSLCEMVVQELVIPPAGKLTAVSK